jgi:hypothetical protein
MGHCDSIESDGVDGSDHGCWAWPPVFHVCGGPNSPTQDVNAVPVKHTRGVERSKGRHLIGSTLAHFHHTNKRTSVGEGGLTV